MSSDDDRKLSSDEKRVVERMYNEGRTVAEISQYLGRPPYLVEKRIERILRRGKEEKEDKSTPITSGLALLGLAFMFLAHIPFWPGILFFGAVMALSDGLEKGKGLKGMEGAVWLTGFGFAFGYEGGMYFLPLLFLTLGIGSVLSGVFRAMRPRRLEVDEEERTPEKRKNEQIMQDMSEKPKRGRLQLSDDGELIDIIDTPDDEDTRRTRQELR